MTIVDIHSDGDDGDKVPTAIQDDSAATNGYGNGDPYIVFGYGSLIFRVRSTFFITTTSATATK